MHFQRSGALLSLLAVLVVHAELKWKCQLIDTSGEATPKTPKTTFVEYVSGKPPEPKIPPRVPRSVGKCRPRPKNGGGGVSTEARSLKIERKKSVVQEDGPGSKPPTDNRAPNVKYLRKETRQSTDLNIGPGFEESNDPYGRNGDPVPRRFRPTHLKGADELDKPLAEHLDENVMPDFELDDDTTPPPQNDLPWCPEESDDCETADLSTLSLQQLVEFKEKCEHSVSPDRLKLIKKLIRTEKGDRGTPDKTDISPPTNSPNCSTDPADLKSPESIEKYRRMCPCETDISKMTAEQVTVFKKECLDPLLIPGSHVRKSGWCLKSQKETDRMDERRYAKFVRQCVVKPDIVLKKELRIIRDSPECRNVKTETLGKSDFEGFLKRCVSRKSCEHIDKTKLNGKQLTQYNAQCNPNPTTRKTNNLCETSNPDSLSDELFEEYKRQCIFTLEPNDYCSTVNPDELSPEEYKEYKVKCSRSPEGPPPVNSRDYCDNVFIEDFNSKEYARYLEQCTPKKPVKCDDMEMDNLGRYNDRKFKKMLFECTTIRNCKKRMRLPEDRAQKWDEECESKRRFCQEGRERLSGVELKKYQKFCEPQFVNCATMNSTDLTSPEDIKIYEQNCVDRPDCMKSSREEECLSPRGELDCLTVEPKLMSRKQYRRFEMECLRNRKDCQDIDVNLLGEQEMEKFKRECVKEKPFDCESVKNVQALSKRELELYNEECSSKKSKCSSLDPRQMTPREREEFERRCLKPTSNCQNVNVKELSEQKYSKFRRECLQEEVPRRPECANIDTDKLTKEEYLKYLEDCGPNSQPDCETVEPKKLSRKQFRKFQEKCITDTSDCLDINVHDLNSREYEDYKKKCMKVVDCSKLNPKELSNEEYKKYQRDCLRQPGNDNFCKTVEPKNLSSEKYREFERRCLKPTSNCQDVNVKKLSEQEYSKFRRECLKEEKPRRPECDNIDTDKLTKEEYLKYLEDCGPSSQLDCETVEPKKLSRKQFRKFQEKCITDTSDCLDINVHDLNAREYEDYKKRCMKITGCSKLNPKELSNEEYKKYQRDCLRQPGNDNFCKTVEPKNLSSEKYREFERRCLKPTSNCQDVNVKELSEQEYRKFSRECRKEEDPRRPECDNIDTDKLTKEEYLKYLEDCGPSSQLDCETVEPKKLSRKQFRKFQEKCITDTSDCLDINVHDLNAREYEDYKKRCMKITDCSKLNPKELSNEEYKKYQRDCLRQPGNDNFCKTVEPKNLSSEKYREFERRCLKPTSNCQDVNVKELSEQEYRKFSRECRKEEDPRRPECDNIDTDKLTKEEYLKYLEDCGPSSQLDCETVEPKKLSRKQFRKFQEKCISDTSDCMNINVRELNAREYEDYKKKCMKVSDCSKLNPKELSKEKYQRYLIDCLNSPANVDFCKTVSPKELSEQEYRDFEKRCLSSAPNCRDVNVKELSVSEYRKFKKECLTRPKCLNVNTDVMTKEEFLKYREDCPKENVQEQNCDTVNPKSLNQKEYRDFEKKCLLNERNCQNVKVKELTDTEYEKFQRECLRPKKNRPDCIGVEPRKMSRKQFTEFQENCVPETSDCKDVNVYDLSSEEYEQYKRRCIVDCSQPSKLTREQLRKCSTRKSFDCDLKEAETMRMSKEQFKRYRKECLPRGTGNCEDANIEEMSSEEFMEHKRRCSEKPQESIKKIVKGGGPNGPESVTLIKKVVVNKGGVPGVRGEESCDDVDVNGLNDYEYKIYLKKCRVTFAGENCEDVDVTALSKRELEKYVDKCGVYCGLEKEMLADRQRSTFEEKCERGERELEKDCKDVELEKIGEKMYAEYAEKCASQTEACSLLKTRRTMKRKAYQSLLLKCNKHIKPPPKRSSKCDNVDTDKMTLQEYQEYQKICGKRTSCANGECDSEVTEQDCGSIEPRRLDQTRYLEYVKTCGPPSDAHCAKVDVYRLSKKEFEGYKKKCVPPGSPSREETGPGTTSRNCSDVKVETLSDAEYRKYKRECEKGTRLECENVKVEELSAEEFAQYKKRCGPSNTRKSLCEDKNVSNMSPEEYEKYKRLCQSEGSGKFDCSNVNLAKLSAEEYELYKQKCRSTRKSYCDDVDVNKLSVKEAEEYRRRCGEKRKSKDCSNANVEKMSAEEFAAYKKKCGTSDRSGDCSNIRVEELSAREYSEYKKRCLEPSDRPDKNCDLDTSRLSEEEFQRYRRRCPGVDRECKGARCLRRPSTTVEKTVKIVTGNEPHDECVNKDTTSMSAEEFEEFTRKCGNFRKTFQFNCNSDVSKMSDVEFKKFRRACGTRPSWKCSDDASTIPKEDYDKYMTMCDTKPWSNYNCRHAKVERMSASEYADYKKKCPSHSKERDSCKDIKVEELSPEEYEEYKKKCVPSQPPKRRRRVDCSIVDTSQLHEADLRDFKKHCSVHVQTDRYRPEDKIILTKKVVIHSGNESFSCYDQDVDKMSDEEYARFEKKCLAIHFRYVCGSEDTTRMSKTEYADYQRECSASNTPETIKLKQTLIINKNGSGVTDGCYNKDVNSMSDEEYAEYEVRCLGRSSTKKPPVRKVTVDCHNVDLSKLSNAEIEQHLKRCRTQEETTTPTPRRQALRCSDVDTDKLDDAAYQKWVRECQTAPQNITLKRILILNNTDRAPPMTGGETVTVQKIEIFGKERPDDDEGSWEGSEDFGVRVKTLTMKKIEGGVPGDDESEKGLVLVKKVVHKIPKRKRPQGSDEDEDEGGVIEVRKMIMKTGSEPDVDDSQDMEEIIRRPPKKVGPREKVVLLSVSKRHGHPYKVKRKNVEEEPTEIVTLKKNTRHPGKVLREVRIKKRFGQGLGEEETVVQEIGGPDFKITRKKIMIPHRVRKLKSTTTTTTTPAEPEYYYEEEEVPEYITLVKVEKSLRPLRKHMRPLDEDEEYVDVKEDQPKSYVEFEGYVKVHGAPRKLNKRPRYTDSGEEPEIREVTRKVVERPGGEDDDFKGVKLRSHVKILKVVKRKEVPEDFEHQVTVVKKLKTMKLGEKERERFTEETGEDGQVIVKNGRRRYLRERVHPQDELENEEFVEGRVAVRGRAPKKFHLRKKMERKIPVVTEENSQYRRIGGEKEDRRIRRGRYEMEEEEEEMRRRRRRFEEEEEEERRRMLLLRKKSRNTEERAPGRGESVTLIKKKVITKDQNQRFGEDEDENEEIRLKRRKSRRMGESQMRDDQDGEQETVKVVKKKSFQFGERPRLQDEQEEDEEIKLKQRKSIYRNGRREYGGDEHSSIYKKLDVGREPMNDAMEDEDREEFKLRSRTKGVKFRGGRKSFYGHDQEGDEEDKMMKRTVYRIGKNGKREVVRKSSEPLNDMGESEGVTIKKGKSTRRFYKIGPNGERQLVRSESKDGGGSGSHGEGIKMFGARKSSWSTEPLGREEGGEGVTIIKRKTNRKVYRIGPNGERELVKDEDGHGGVQKRMFGDQSGSGSHDQGMKMYGAKKSTWSTEPLGTEQGEGVTISKSMSNRKFYRIGPNGERQLIKEQNRDGGVQKQMFGDSSRGGMRDGMSMIGAKKSSRGAVLVGPDNDVQRDADPQVSNDKATKRMRPTATFKAGFFKGGSAEVLGSRSKKQNHQPNLGNVLSRGRSRGDSQNRREQPIVGSTRGGMSHSKKMRQYSRDEHLRSGGKSEEDVPDAH